MNIFILDRQPHVSATMLCDKHVPKMCVESLQMLASAARRHGATDDQMPLSEAGSPIKGGYHNHPCTRWAGDSRSNFTWLASHGLGLCQEFTVRFNKVHKCEHKIESLLELASLIPDGSLTSFALAMPEQYRSEDAVASYRRYYAAEKSGIAKWEKGRPSPEWWCVA
jgi:hypothetical protein